MATKQPSPGIFDRDFFDRDSADKAYREALDAIAAEKPAALRRALKRSAGVHYVPASINQTQTLLYCAFAKGHVPCIQALVDAGAVDEKCKKFVYSMIKDAAQKHGAASDVVRVLVGGMGRIDPHCADVEGYCGKLGDYLALKAVADSDTKDYTAAASIFAKGYDFGFHLNPANPLQCGIGAIVQSDDPLLLEMAITAGALRCDREGVQTAFANALERGQTGMVRAFCEAGVIAPVHTSDFDETDEYFQRLLCMVDPGRSPQTLHMRLFKENKDKWTPLDNPKTWHMFPEIEKVLFAQRTPLTKEDLFETNSEGETWLAVAVRARTLQPVMEHLERQHTPLTMQDIESVDGLYDLMCEKGQARYLFNPAFMAREGGVGAVERIYHHMPDIHKWQVTNRMRVKAEISAAHHTPGSKAR